MSEGHGSTPRILVIDDDDALSEMLEIVLGSEGFEARCCRTGDAALSAFRDYRPDLVLLDLMLPGRDGVDVCRDIRAESGVPVVMLTARSDTSDVVHGLEAGADDYITKPFSPRELVARLRAVMRRSPGEASDPLIEVEGLTIEGEKVTNVVFEHGRLETDAVLITAGVWSPQIARYAKRRVPIQGGKGYSLDYTPAPVEVRHPIEVFDTRHVITPLDGMTRLAGTMEFSGNNAILRPERVEAIVRGTADIIRGWPTDLSMPVVSSGLRPMSPDGLPIIGLLKGYRNLAIATGHGMMGLSLGPVTGAAIADLLTDNSSREILQPFDPARF